MAYDPLANILTDIPGALNIQQTTTPSILPPSGYDLLYFKSDNNLYRLTSGGVEAQVSSIPTAQSANTVNAGPASGSAALPTYRPLVLADLPAIPYSYITGTATLVTPILQGVQMSVSAKVSNYNMTSTDFMILASGSAFTITLPNAATAAVNQVYAIKKTDSSFTNIITIATTASQTIDGSSTTTLNTLGETIELISDGANWQILTRRIPSVTTAYTPTFGAGFGTPTNVTCFYRRIGDNIQIFGSFTVGTTTTAAGTITLPSGLSAIAGLSSLNALVGSTTTAVESLNAQVNLAGLYIVASGTQVVMCNVANGSVYNNLSALQVSQVIGPGVNFSFYATIPISGWNG